MGLANIRSIEHVCCHACTCLTRARRDGARSNPHSSTGALPLAMDSGPRPYYTSSPAPPPPHSVSGAQIYGLAKVSADTCVKY